MQTTGHLLIQIFPSGDSADLFINGRHYLLDPGQLPTPEHLRDHLAGQPEYVIAAVIGMLKEMACS